MSERSNRDAAQARAATAESTSGARVALSWLLVTVPLLYGLYETLLDTAALFGG